MKKLFFALFLLLGSISAYSQQLQINAFLASNEFATLYGNSAVASYGTVVSSEANIKNYKVIGDERPIPVIRIPVKRNGVVVGLLEGVKIKDGINPLPANARYIVGYRDYRNYNFNTKTGTIIEHDLNYNQAFTIQVNNGTITNTDPGPSTAFVPCDLNGNGNLGWGECYSCVTDACENDPDCNLMCDLMDIYETACTISLATGCAVLSMMY